MRTCRQQKPPSITEFTVYPNAKKEWKKPIINLKRGSQVYVIESESNCAIRLLRKLDNIQISDSDFRKYVRTLIQT